MGEMFLCKRRMDSGKYIKVLEKALIPSFLKIFGDTNLVGFKFQ